MFLIPINYTLLRPLIVACGQVFTPRGSDHPRNFSATSGIRIQLFFASLNPFTNASKYFDSKYVLYNLDFPVKDWE